MKSASLSSTDPTPMLDASNQNAYLPPSPSMTSASVRSAGNPSVHGLQLKVYRSSEEVMAPLAEGRKSEYQAPKDPPLNVIDSELLDPNLFSVSSNFQPSLLGSSYGSRNRTPLHSRGDSFHDTETLCSSSGSSFGAYHVPSNSHFFGESEENVSQKDRRMHVPERQRRSPMSYHSRTRSFNHWSMENYRPSHHNFATAGVPWMGEKSTSPYTPDPSTPMQNFSLAVEENVRGGRLSPYPSGGSMSSLSSAVLSAVSSRCSSMPEEEVPSQTNLLNPCDPPLPRPSSAEVRATKRLSSPLPETQARASAAAGWRDSRVLPRPNRQTSPKPTADPTGTKPPPPQVSPSGSEASGSCDNSLVIRGASPATTGHLRSSLDDHRAAKAKLSQETEGEEKSSEKKTPRLSFTTTHRMRGLISKGLAGWLGASPPAVLDGIARSHPAPRQCYSLGGSSPRMLPSAASADGARESLSSSPPLACSASPAVRFCEEMNMVVSYSKSEEDEDAVDPSEAAPNEPLLSAMQVESPPNNSFPSSLDDRVLQWSHDDLSTAMTVFGASPDHAVLGVSLSSTRSALPRPRGSSPSVVEEEAESVIPVGSPAPPSVLEVNDGCRGDEDDDDGEEEIRLKNSMYSEPTTLGKDMPQEEEKVEPVKGLSPPALDMYRLGLQTSAPLVSILKRGEKSVSEPRTEEETTKEKRRSSLNSERSLNVITKLSDNLSMEDVECEEVAEKFLLSNSLYSDSASSDGTFIDDSIT